MTVHLSTTADSLLCISTHCLMWLVYHRSYLYCADILAHNFAVVEHGSHGTANRSYVDPVPIGYLLSDYLYLYSPELQAHPDTLVTTLSNNMCKPPVGTVCTSDVNPVFVSAPRRWRFGSTLDYLSPFRIISPPGFAGNRVKCTRTFAIFWGGKSRQF